MLKIYGASDDLVEIEGHVTDEIGCYDKNVLLTIGWPNEETPQMGRGLYVLMRYSPPHFNHGCWTAELSPLEEEAEIPWPVSIKLGRRGYTVEINIECPDDVPVSWKKIPA